MKVRYFYDDPYKNYITCQTQQAYERPYDVEHDPFIRKIDKWQER